MTEEIKTPWGRIIPEVSLFPIYYLLFIYGFVYIFPYGKFFIGISWFDWFRSEDGPLEWIQFVEYALSSLIAFMIFIKKKNKKEINSIIVEGGTTTIQHFIDSNLWDEARIFITHHELCKGRKSPSIDKKNWNEKKVGTDSLITLHND